MKQVIIPKNKKEFAKHTKEVIQLYQRVQEANFNLLADELKLDKEQRKTLYYYLFSNCNNDVIFQK